MNWDSFKWRNYDYALGRFMSVDPLAEKFSKWTPYAFAGNQVVHSRELEGLEPEDDLGGDYGISYPTQDEFQTGGPYIDGSVLNDVVVGGLRDFSRSDESYGYDDGRFSGQEDNDNDYNDWRNTDDGGDRTHICTSGVLYARDPIFRMPDYINANVSVSIPGTGGLLGWNGSLSLSRYGNVYFSPLGFSVGKSLFDQGSLSITANWLDQSTVPSAYQMNNFLSGNGFNAGGGYWIGGGETWSPGNGTATGAGFYTPQIGGSYNYTPNTLIFGSNFTW